MNDDEVSEQVRQVCADYDAANPGWQQNQRDREAREHREAEERAQRALATRRQTEQQQAATNSATWANWVDQRIAEHLEVNWDSMRDVIGDVIAKERASQQKAVNAAVAEATRGFEAKIEMLERRISGYMEQSHHNAIASAGHALDEAVTSERAERQKEIAKAQYAIEWKLTVLEQRLKATPGKLPVARTWEPETVSYQGDFVSYKGALYQARKDTAQVPGGEEWLCVARAGRDGTDGRTPNICGTYDAYGKYKKLDIVACDGAAFIATHDNPSICPGDGWQMISRQGKPGRPGRTGERGPRGEKGEPGVVSQIMRSKIDKNYDLIIDRTDTREIIPLRAAFEQYHRETENDE